MAQVMFSFLGVCTYFPTFRDFDPSPDAPAHRMLLVNGGPNALTKIPASGLDPHTAKIQMFRDQIVSIDPPEGFPASEAPDSYTFSLSDNLGMKIWVENAIGSFGEADIANLPGLRAHLSIALPPPNSFVFDEDPTGASVYVDFDLGMISAYRLPVLDSGMGITQLVIDTPPGEDVIVKFRQFRSDNEWTVTLRSGTSLPAGVNVTNMATSGLRENPLDFYLQYLAVQPPFPPINDITLVNTVPILLLPLSPFDYGMPVNGFDGFDADPGCSNSHYP